MEEKKDQIRNIAAQGDLKNVKKLAKINRELDEELSTWHRNELNQRAAITGRTLKQQALIINTKLGGNENLSFSYGWLSKYKKRCSIRGLKITGKFLLFIQHKLT